MIFADSLTLDAPKRTADGYYAVRARAARVGTYEYLGNEIDPQNKHGLRDAGTVNVLRDDSTVFDEASARSFIGKPITDNHPHEPVTADNWKRHARGTVMGAMRDGDYLAFDLLLTDAAAIRKIDAGKRELSNGYEAHLEFGDFTASDGTKCVARQVSVRGNHVALVDRGRAGPSCAIRDAAACASMSEDFVSEWLSDQRTYSEKPEQVKTDHQRRETVDQGNRQMATKTITFDGLPLEVTDAAEAAINKLNAKISDAVAAKDKAEADLAAAKTETVTKDATIATLTQQLADAKPTPAQLRDAAKAYAGVCDKAKALGVKVDDSADADAIMKAVVDAKMGEAAKDWTADQIAASFAVLSKDAKADPLRETIRDSKPSLFTDGADIMAAVLAARDARQGVVN